MLTAVLTRRTTRKFLGKIAAEPILYYWDALSGVCGSITATITLHASTTTRGVKVSVLRI